MISAQSRSNRLAMAGAIVLFVVLYALTVGQTTGDTPVYADDILRAFQNAPGARAGLWEFGHLIWRPLGLAAWRLAHPLFSPWFGGNPLLEINAALFTINFLAALALVPLCFAFCVRLGAAPRLAWAVTAALLLTDALLTYLHSGSSYTAGLAWMLAGQILFIDALREQSRLLLRSGCAAVSFALSAATWFPYILSLPAALLIAWIAGQPLATRERARRLGIAIVFTALAGLIVFGLGSWFAGAIESVSRLTGWISASAHGIRQTQRLIRLPTGIARSFFYLGDDGVLLKRFVFGDPYAPVRWYDLAAAGLWKIAIVFAALAMVIWTAARRRDWSTLSILAAGSLPALLFALLLFETSAPERYLPVYPALLACLCAVARAPRAKAARFILALTLGVMTVVNLWAFGWQNRRTGSEAFSRAHSIAPHIQHHGIAFLVSFRDPLSSYIQRHPFGPEDFQHALPLYHVIEPGAARVANWRSDAACRVLQAWREGGEAWLSLRLLAPVPMPEWDWVEHDDGRVRWADLPGFFKQADTDETIGGSDGFTRIAEDTKNRALYERACR